MRPIVKEILQNVDMSDDNGWIDFQQFIEWANRFLSDFQGNIALADKHRIFWDISGSAKDDDGNITELAIHYDEFRRIRDTIKRYADNPEIQTRLFLFYLLYRSDYYWSDLIYHKLKYGAEIAAEEQARSNCVKHSDKWSEIRITFNAAKLKRNQENTLEDCDVTGKCHSPGKYKSCNECAIANSGNPIDAVTILWQKKHTILILIK